MAWDTDEVIERRPSARQSRLEGGYRVDDLIVFWAKLERGAQGRTLHPLLCHLLDVGFLFLQHTLRIGRDRVILPEDRVFHIST